MPRILWISVGRVMGSNGFYISGVSLAKAARAIDEIPDELKVILVTSNDFDGPVPAVDRVVRKDRALEAALIATLKEEGLLR